MVLPCSQHFLEWDDDDGEGFFAYLHFVDVHFPYQPPEAYAGRWAGPMPDEDYNTVAFMETSYRIGHIRP